MVQRGISTVVAVVALLLGGALCAADSNRPPVEDPSYEPPPDAPRSNPLPREVGLSGRAGDSTVKITRSDPVPREKARPENPKKTKAPTPKITADVKVPAAEMPDVFKLTTAEAPTPVPPPVTSTTYPTAVDPRTGETRRVKYVLDGKPVFEGDPDPVAASAARSAQPAPIEAPIETGGPATRPHAPIVHEIPGTVEISVEKLPDGRVRNVLIPPAPPPAYTPGTLTADAPVYRPAPAAPVRSASDDVTADKPGALAAGTDRQLFDDIQPKGEVNSKAKKCYAALAEMKANIESVNRLLDNRGRENARLLHTSDEIVKNISELVAIWPSGEAFRDVCVTAKRSALVFNEELNQVPWRWNHVRWTFNALLRDARPLREMAKAMAEAEPKPLMVVDKKGQVTYVDAPDPLVDPVTAAREARFNATRDELSKAKGMEERRAEALKADRFKKDLDGH